MNQNKKNKKKKNNKKNKKNKKKKKKKKKRTPAPPGNVRPNSFVPRAPKGTHAGEGSLASTKCRCLSFLFPAFYLASRLEKELDCTSAQTNSARAKREFKTSTERSSGNEDGQSF